jgi:hypothetical protein
LLAHLKRDSARREAGGDTAGFKHNNFTANTFEERWRHAGRFARTRWGFDDKARRRPTSARTGQMWGTLPVQGFDNLRQDRVHRKSRIAAHDVSSKHGGSGGVNERKPVS